ncbi:MAG: TolC family protein [Acidobacteriota bacterium]|nr:TolC family protein [Acidobacteriota bacterium]
MRVQWAAAFVAALTVGGTLAADPPLTLSRAACTALANSRAVLAADASAKAAAARARQARAHRLPQVDFSEVYHRTDSPAESFALQLNQERFDMQAFFGWIPTTRIPSPPGSPASRWSSRSTPAASSRRGSPRPPCSVRPRLSGAGTPSSR